MYSVYYKLSNRWMWYTLQLPFSAIPFLFFISTLIAFFPPTETLVHLRHFWSEMSILLAWFLKEMALKTIVLLVCDTVISTDF